MLLSQKLEIRSVELRAKLSELAGLETLTDEQRSELEAKTNELRDVEKQRVAALETEALEARETEHKTEDAETRERKELECRASLSEYLAAASEGRGVTGAALEFNQSLKMNGNAFPLAKLAPSVEELEQRSTTDVDSQVISKRWLDRLFYGTAASRLGISYESVGAGVASYQVTATGPATGAQRGRGEAVADSAWTITTKELKPSRNAVSLTFSVEDMARIGPQLEAALMRDIRAAMVYGLDRAIFLGDDGANENGADITGLSTSGISEATLKQSDKVKADKVLATFLSLVDGRHANMAGDLNIVASVSANTLWEATYAASSASTESIAKVLRNAGISWGVRGEIADNTSADSMLAYVSLAQGLSGAAVAPVWQNASLIRDPYSGATKGEITVTLTTLWNFDLVRSNNFKRVKAVA